MSGLRCGDWVFVHPDERSAPPKIRGLAGTISRLSGERATVRFRCRGATISLEVDVSILRPERRRRNRPPAHWPHEIAQTG
ncbi:MAG TPA: hypothetical protein VFI04_08180 [Gaiellaceae bacterium]|nr:hypothetical protein [Gaiellaceae bacterium]